MHSRCPIVALDSIRLGKALVLILWQNGYGKLIMADRTTLEALRPAKAPKGPRKTSVSSEERERIFDAFRRWGYLEADLDPLKLFKPLKYPDLELTGAVADEARRHLLRHGWCGVYALA